MATLLRIDSSALSQSNSFSRQLTDEFVEQWRAANPGGTVVSRDLATTELPVLTADWIAAAYTPEAHLTPEQRQILAVSNELIAELQSADEYVIGVPMYNFSIPGSLKLWIDQVARAGKTFAYENGAPVGKLKNKKATLLIASGGSYLPGSPMGHVNFVEPYLRWMLGFMGIQDVKVIYAAGTSKARQGVDRGTILEPALTSIRAQFQAA